VYDVEVKVGDVAVAEYDSGSAVGASWHGDHGGLVVRRAVNVVNMEFVTVDATGAIVTLENFEGESLPRPVVELNPVNLSVAGTHLTGTVSGSVRDAFADMVDGGADIAAEDVKIYANGALVGTAADGTFQKVAESPPGNEQLVRPYAHRAEFSVPVSFFADPAVNTVTVEVENSVGQMGADTTRVPTTRGNPYYAEVRYTAYIETPLVFDQQDTVKFYAGDREPEPDDPDSAEIEEDQAANLSCFEHADGLARTQLVIVDFTGLDPNLQDSFTGTARFSRDDGEAWTEVTTTFTETDVDTHRFLAVLAFGGDAGTITLGTPIEDDSTPGGTFKPFLARVDGAGIEDMQFDLNGVTFNVVAYNGEYYLGLSPPATFAFVDPKTKKELPEPPRKQFLDTSAQVRMVDGPHVGVLYHFELTPRLFVAGDKGPNQQRVEVRVKIWRTGLLRDYSFETGDTFEIVKSDDPAKKLPLSSIHVDGGELVGKIDEVPKDFAGVSSVGDYDLVIDQTAREGGKRKTYAKMLRVIDRIRIVLVFDDGPSNTPLSSDDPAKIASAPAAANSPNSTERVLYHLKKCGEDRYGEGEGIVALFNVITSYRHVGRVSPFAAADEPGAPGRKLLEIEGQRHIIGIHDGWEGDHTAHWWQLDTLAALKAAYEDPETQFPPNPVLWTHNPPDDGAPLAMTDTRLEWNLRQCEHFLMTGNAGGPFIDPVEQIVVRYVRSPRWGCTSATRAVYQKLGLGVGGNGWPVAGDTKHGDGLNMWSTRWGMREGFPKQVVAALRGGHSQLVVTYHDWNEETATYLPSYLDSLEKAIYEEVGIQMASKNERYRLIEFVHDRADLVYIVDYKIVFQDFYSFPDYPEMRF
jgi:hypothetical protein